jgi:protein-S-isoprenylcysteine O-methyltransferase Ste14
VLVVALTLAVVTLQTLGHAFSLTPQARALVSTGPYRLVRHPLYLCEALAIICIAVRSGRATMLIVAVLVLAAQVRRAQLEERLLSKAFPEYEEVFASVPHFLPGIF